MKTKIEINIDTKKRISKKTLLALVCWVLEWTGLEGDTDYKAILRK